MTIGEIDNLGEDFFAAGIVGDLAAFVLCYGESETEHGADDQEGSGKSECFAEDHLSINQRTP